MRFTRKSSLTVLFVIAGVLLSTCLAILLAVPIAYAQETQTVLKPNQLFTYLLAPNQDKLFVLQMKRGDSADIQSLAREGLNLSLEIYDSTRKDLLEKSEVGDDFIWFVAPRDGDFILVCKLGESAEISGSEKISIQYNNKLKLTPGTKLKAIRKVNGYDIKIMATPESSEDGGPILLFEKNGQLQKAIKRDTNYGFIFADDINFRSAKEIQLIKTTPDKTGNGIPDIMIDYFSGGAHCCFSTYFFDLGDTVKLGDILGGGDSQLTVIRKNPKGGLIFRVSDYAFGYWLTSFAQSPAPTVILEFRNGKLRPNFELMKKAAPTFVVLKKEAQVQIQQLRLEPYNGEKSENCRRPMFIDMNGTTQYSFEPCLYKDDASAPVFWGRMLDLIYTGNEELAWQFLDLVWPRQKQGKELFIRDFKDRLLQSWYWPMILEDRKK